MNTDFSVMRSIVSGEFLTSITAKNAENAKITVTTNSKRTHNKLFQPEFGELSASAVRVLCKFGVEI